MPLWQIYHPKDAFSDAESKQALSADVVKMYTTQLGLPAFYVVVQFIAMPEESVWVGGLSKTEKPFIRIVINHVAVRVANISDEDAVYKQTCEMVDAALKPHVEDKGYDWEYHLDETERRLWKVNGLVPPPWKSEAEQQWVKTNRPLSWEGDH
ncbi:hypothetical protein NA57DRAFT_49915 [Rhizodiscina lignyota]|uniref:Tautomerase cis-CaaD-like domain-containing protein n=1 Tax=Rhizodiscina lignyota TaxID=1504668 RepID=A0A9P4I0A5_9PEZI|nr:hypothetical protein NA57DRAFT_49915 [Rhizodiscina lignyota]